MEKNDLKQQIIDKINSRTESINLFLDLYDENDVIELYVYDLIAYILNSSINNIKNNQVDGVLENYILNMIHQKNESDEIKISYFDIKKVLNIIDNNRFSEKTLNELEELFICKEVLIDLDYQLNLEKSSIKKDPQLSKNFNFVKSQIDQIFNDQKNRISIIKRPESFKSPKYNTFETIIMDIYGDKSNYKVSGWKKTPTSSDSYYEQINNEQPKKR